MSRDFELIKRILKHIETGKPLGWMIEYGSPEFREHLRLLKEADFIQIDGDSPYPDAPGSTKNSWQPNARLKWKGHDFIAAADNETVWKKFLKQGKSAGLDVAMELLKELVKRQVLDG